jgi:CheY-like chemotaxis protein
MKTFLLIDDDYVTRLIHEKMIREEDPNAVIYFASNGKEAMKFIEYSRSGIRNFPSVIFLDMDMPQMNGFEFLEALKTLTPKPSGRVYMISSSVNPNHHIKAMQNGAENFFSKPLRHEDLKEILRRV